MMKSEPGCLPQPLPPHWPSQGHRASRPQQLQPILQVSPPHAAG
jgi:hypothetical protein